MTGPGYGDPHLDRLRAEMDAAYQDAVLHDAAGLVDRFRRAYRAATAATVSRQTWLASSWIGVRKHVAGVLTEAGHSALRWHLEAERHRWETLRVALDGHDNGTEEIPQAWEAYSAAREQVHVYLAGLAG